MFIAVSRFRKYKTKTILIHSNCKVKIKVILREVFMRRKTRAKIKRVLTIIGAIIGVLLIILGIIWVIKLNQEPEISYDDGITCKNYFTEITINFEKQEVKRDNIETSLEEEFNISTEQSIIAYS